MIQPTANPSIFQLSRIVSHRQGANRVSVPVDQSLVMYSRYRHVHGIPSYDKDGGLPLERLRVLDTLIDRLINLRTGGPLVKDVEALSSNEINQLIEDYQAELHNALKRKMSFPDFNQSPDVGLVVDLVA